MISKKIEQLLNDQMNFEIFSAYVYRAMGAYCDVRDLSGFSNWFKVQAQEEEMHAEKIYNFVLDRGGEPVYKGFGDPGHDWESVIKVFEEALGHEQVVTERFNNLMTEAVKENDHATRSFLNWFIDEQVEEEATAQSVVNQLKILGDSGHGILMMDREMAARKFVPAAE